MYHELIRRAQTAGIEASESIPALDPIYITKPFVLRHPSEPTRVWCSTAARALIADIVGDMGSDTVSCVWEEVPLQEEIPLRTAIPHGISGSQDSSTIGQTGHEQEEHEGS